jgi:ABC-type sugar transport system substrate-binding protein/DNA-binding response OmpR family regulator/two-component sensor histidine kinase
MITRTLLWLFLFATILSNFWSCRNASDENKVRIGFSQAMSKDDWRRAMNNSMRLQASLDPNINLTILDADYEIEKQIEQIEKFIADSMDILIISPIQSRPITPVVQKALDAGIPVLVVDRKTENETYTAYLGADNVEVGKNGAKEIIASKTGDTISILEIKGLAGSSPAKERSLGFHHIIKSVNNMTIIDTINGNWEKESIQEKFKAFLLAGNKVDFVFAHNDRMARGAWEVARDLGVEKDIDFIGVDGLNTSSGGIRLVQNGILKATILYPTGGDEAIKLAMRILNKEDVPKNNILSTTIINKVNADIMQNQFDKINEQQGQIEEQLTAIKKQEELYYSQNNLLKVSMALLAIIFSLALYSIYSIFTIRKKNRLLEFTNNKITVQRNQIAKIARKVKESNEAKINFFTGLSHEFKTPLTLIMSSVESLVDRTDSRGSRIHNETELIRKNANRLLRLINNLLDFRKVEDQSFNLRASRTNIHTFSRKIFDDFAREAKRRNIGFTLTCENKDLELYIDRNLMDKVYFNLLSNAFKFTPDNGVILLKIEEDKDNSKVDIHFVDNGIGIPENELKHVFEPFFKGSNNRQNSSGIGLHLSQQFVKLHMGKICVKSHRGTEFIISLFKGKTHFNEDQLVEEPELVHHSLSDYIDESVVEETYLSPERMSDSEQHSVLVVEDNKDLLTFLKSKLGLEYEVHLSDGTDAVEKALELIPDIIICDVNLPGKNGFEICRELKQDLRSSHIPTIILTALSDKDSYLQGLQSGADLYLTKPFSFAILIQSIKSLLYNREKLRYYYTNQVYRIEDKDSFNNIEQQFLNNLNSMIRDNLDNPGFSVEHLAEALHISRVQLYRKVKAMMGVSISDYINDFRLEKARNMLENTTLTVAEIAYSHGFSSPNYFSTSFKHKYGVSPVLHRRTH